MENGTALVPTISRLKELVERQYGCLFEYQSVETTNAELLIADLEKGSPVTAGDWVFFPVFKGAELAGTGRISSRESINDQDLQRLHQVIRMVIEGALVNVDRIELIQQLEDHISRITDNKNVIPINNYRANPFPLRSVHTEKNTTALNFSFLIESQNQDDIFRMAIEIHHFAKRFAFMRLEDLTADARSSVEALRSLGNVTIYVEDIARLKFSEQENLKNYFASSRDRECPQIVAGTSLPLSELKKSCLVDNSLLNHLMTGYIRLNSSFKNYKNAELVEFFFNQLTGRQS